MIKEDISKLREIIKLIDGAIDDYTGNRPIEDVIGEIGLLTDKALEIIDGI